MAWPVIRLVAPEIPISLRVFARGPALQKPRMLVGRMVRHKIQNHLEAAAMDFFEQAIEVFHGAEDRIDAAIIGDIVSKIGHRRRIDRRDPDGVDAKLHQIVEPLQDPVQIANAVAIAVLKRARVDLVDDAVLPPSRILHLNQMLLQIYLLNRRIARMINDLWYKNAVIYCLSVATYMDANGDGIGDFQGLMRRLDYLQGMGVTAIWLMPFQPSPGRDDGYDIADYYGVDPRYGTLGDFVEFTARLQAARDARPDRPGRQSHFERASLVSGGAAAILESKYRDWYVWSKKKPKNASIRSGVSRSAEVHMELREDCESVLLSPLL